MSRINDDGPVFLDGSPEPEFMEVTKPLHQGVSLRDYLAAASMQGQRAADTGYRSPWGRLKNLIGLGTGKYISTSESVARCAYQDADAMLQQRKEQ